MCLFSGWEQETWGTTQKSTSETLDLHAYISVILWCVIWSSGTRFRQFDSPKQSGGHISEVSTSLSSQSGVYTICTYATIVIGIYMLTQDFRHCLQD